MRPSSGYEDRGEPPAVMTAEDSQKATDRSVSLIGGTIDGDAQAFVVVEAEMLASGAIVFLALDSDDTGAIARFAVEARRMNGEATT